MECRGKLQKGVALRSLSSIYNSVPPGKLEACATFFERFTSSCDMASPYFDFHLGAGVSHNAKKSARKLMDPFFLPHLKRFLR
jgi:hypothetical protein